MAVITVNEQNFETEVLQAEVPVLVDFWATWCGPCKMQAPIIDKLAEEITSVKFAKLDVDQNIALAQKYRVMSIPTLLLFKNGEVAETVIGLSQEDKIRRTIGV